MVIVNSGIWVTQLIKGPTLGLSSGLDLRVVSSSPVLASMLGVEPTLFIFSKDFYYLFDRKRHSERGNTSRESGRERSRLPGEQRAQCGALSQDPGIRT